MKAYDTLLHISSETETPIRSISNFMLYFLLWTGGKSHRRRPALMSMNQLASYSSYDTGISKYNIANIFKDSPTTNFTNYKQHYMQGYTEVKSNEDYVAVALDYAIPLSKNIKISGGLSNWGYLTKYSRLVDKKEFYFVQLTKRWAGYLNPYSYRALSAMLRYIQRNYPGDYIITGDFNVQGHEQVFIHFLGEDKYHIVPFYKYATCNDNEGVASPDGIVVSKALYNRVEYTIDFYPGYSYQHFIVGAKLYRNAKKAGTFPDISDGFLSYLDTVKTNHGDRDYFVGHKGIFNPSNKTMIGRVEDVQEVRFPSSGPITYKTQALYTKLNELAERALCERT